MPCYNTFSMPNLLRILILEDNPLTAQALALLLEDAGYFPMVAHSFEKALFLLKEQKPDLALLDIRLSSDKTAMTGIDFAHLMQRENAIPYLFLSAHTDEYFPEIRAASPIAVFEKPWSERNILMAIELAVEHFSEGKIESDSLSQPAKTLRNVYFSPGCLWLKQRINERDQFSKVLVDDLEFVEIDNVYLSFFVKNRPRPIVLVGNLTRFWEAVRGVKGFSSLVKIGDKRIVNARHVTRFSTRSLTVGEWPEFNIRPDDLASLLAVLLSKMESTDSEAMPDHIEGFLMLLMHLIRDHYFRFYFSAVPEPAFDVRMQTRSDHYLLVITHNCPASARPPGQHSSVEFEALSFARSLVKSRGGTFDEHQTERGGGIHIHVPRK